MAPFRLAADFASARIAARPGVAPAVRTALPAGDRRGGGPTGHSNQCRRRRAGRRRPGPRRAI